MKFTTRFDGYAIADRLLEEVMFDVEIELMDNTISVTSVKLTGLHYDYVAGLGAPGTVEHWCDQVRKYFEDDMPYAFFEEFEADERLTEEVMDEIERHYERSNQ